jgi:asparagine synthase (glutamine-hydrolysing)
VCGFLAGVFDADTAPSEAQVEAALDAMGHRGPDGRGHARIPLADGRVAILGHVRLALVGVGDGRQPFVSDRAATVVNGEFYGWREARAALERAGARFATRTDSEIAHAAFTLRGAQGWTDGLDGEWAMAAVDLRAGTLHTACDPFGAKPLRHWTSRDGRSSAVASEAKALFALGIPASLDDASLRFAMGLQYLPVGRTLFSGIGMVPPGCRFDHAAGRGRVTPWHDPFAEAPDDGCGEPTPGEAIALLRAAVRRRIPEEASFATHLSGGLDSALVLALAAEAQGPGIEAFTASVPFGPDESAQAAETARHVGARLVPVPMPLDRLLAAMERAPFHSEGLSMNAHAGAKLLIAQAVRERGHKAVLTGEGADEAFWGYEHLRLDAGVAMPDGLGAATFGIHRPEAEAGGLEGLAAALGGPVPGFVRTKAAAAIALAPVLGDRLEAAPFDAADLAGHLPASWLASLRRRPGAEAARGLWSVHGLSGYILRGLDDALGMAHGVESRLAFLDPALNALARRTAPARHFGAGGIEKRLLREGAGGILPQAVLTRPKSPFMIPALTGTPEGEAWARDRILGGRLVGAGLVRESGVDALLAQPDRPVRDAHLLALASLSGLVDAFGLA